jgi:hypothetical protein
MHSEKSRKRAPAHAKPADDTCSVAGCSRPQHAQGLCQVHFDARRKAAAIAAKPAGGAPPASTKNCCVPGCTAPHHARGYCKSHYSQLRRRGSVRDSAASTSPTCEVVGCSKPVAKDNRCEQHAGDSTRHMTKGERLSEIKARHDLMRREIERIKQSFEAEREDEE